MSRVLDLLGLCKSTYQHIDGTVMPNGWDERMHVPLARPASAPPQRSVPRRRGGGVPMGATSAGEQLDSDHIDLMKWRDNKEYTEFLFGSKLCGRARVRLFLEAGSPRARPTGGKTPAAVSVKSSTRKETSRVLRQRLRERSIAAAREAVSAQRRRAQEERASKQVKVDNEHTLRRHQRDALKRRKEMAAGMDKRVASPRRRVPGAADAAVGLAAGVAALAAEALVLAAAAMDSPAVNGSRMPSPDARAMHLLQRERVQATLIQAADAARRGQYTFQPVGGGALKVREVPQWVPEIAPAPRPRFPFTKKQGFLSISGPARLPTALRHQQCRTWYGAVYVQQPNRNASAALPPQIPAPPSSPTKGDAGPAVRVSVPACG
eukprot:TRINITY_DN6018_c0_g1_i1.p1 TRINITY_DN6018_c0_g1~~TRINITY_DN6018_c0_g1_i1.p1  ORF type:complete len:378 (+),score=86.66 TRINITY_DN6018_c0_g1_i1:118-1251(+)